MNRASTEPSADHRRRPVGLAAAGREVHLDLRVVVSDPVQPGLPDSATVTHLNGQRVTSREHYREQQAAASGRHGQMSFRTADGAVHVVDGVSLPYRSIWLVDAATGVDAAVGGHGPPYSWVRSMSMGPSHGLMVGLVTYVSAADDDLAAGRHVAGTGKLHGEGTVGRIGGLAAKAAGARRAGADVLLVPAGQHDQLDGFDPGGMQVIPVASLDDAIEALRASR